MVELLAFDADQVAIQVRPGLRKTYTAKTDELHEHLQEGGVVGALPGFVQYAKEQIRANAGHLLAVEGWVYLDDAPVAYLVEVRASGRYTIIGAGVFPRSLEPDVVRGARPGASD